MIYQKLRTSISITLVLATCIFALSLGLRVYKIDNSSIWMDEDAQAEKILKGRNKPPPNNLSLTERAAQQHQPPVDYFAEAVFLHIFGPTELGARFHAALWGSFASVILFLLIVTIIKKPVFAALFTLLFVFNPELIFYSQEGRPISCGVFFATLYLYVVIRFLLTDTDTQTTVAKAGIYFVVTVLFLLSSGFQPIVFCLVFAICFTPLLLLRNYRLKAILLLLMSLAAFVAALPTLKLSMAQGLHIIGNKPLPSKMFPILESLGSPDISTWMSKYTVLLGDYSILAAGICITGLVCLAISFKRTNKRIVLSIGLLILFVVLYPWVFDVVFHGLITRPLKYRYYLSFAPALLALVALLGCLVLTSIDRILIGRPRMVRAVPIILAAFLFIYCSVPGFEKIGANYQTQKKTDWRSLYQLLKEDGQAGDIAFMMNLVGPNKWQPYFHATRFYYPPSHRRPVKLSSLKRFFKIYKNSFFNKRKTVYFVTAYGHQHLNQSHIEGLEHTSFHKFHRLSVIQIKDPPNMQTSVRNLFKQLKVRVRKRSQTAQILEIEKKLGGS